MRFFPMSELFKRATFGGYGVAAFCVCNACRWHIKCPFELARDLSAEGGGGIRHSVERYAECDDTREPPGSGR